MPDERPPIPPARQSDGVPAVVPPPPVAAVHRPSGWRGASTPEAPAPGAAGSAPAAPGAPGASAPGPERRIEHGAVTERIVREAGAAGQRLVLGRGAVVTPLALDRARRLGVEITRER
jgi:hypothetical protein